MIQKRWLGLTSYGVGLEFQDQATRWAREHGEMTVLGLEHEPVITLGKRGNAAVDLNSVERELPIVRADRGGQATLHSPGQLVIYPVLPMKKMNLTVSEYVGYLHETTAELLANYGIETSRGDESGLFTGQGKIAFFGVRIEQGVTRHGLSLNVSNDLTLFQGIRSCGVTDARLDSMANHGKNAPLQTLFQEWTDLFEQRLSLTSTQQWNITKGLLYE